MERNILARAGRSGVAVVVLAAFAAWHCLLASLRDTVNPAAGDPLVVEYERNVYDYVRGFDVHHGTGEAPGDSPEHGSFPRDLRVWLDANCLRGYTLGNEVYVLANAPRAVRVHQSGHAPAFGRTFDTLQAPRCPDGGLPDEPLTTLDVMVPGRFPHTFFRVRDRRGLRAAYVRWLRKGHIVRR